MQDDRLQQHYDARDRHVRNLGTPDPDLLAPLLNPGLTGGPLWPGLRESWRRVQRGPCTLVVSDGLSDPYDDDDTPNVGLGVEVLVATLDPVPDPVQASWLFTLAYDISQQAADSGAFRELRDELGLFSMELYADEAFGPAVTEGGRVGVLFGLEAPGLALDWQLPGGLVRVVTAKLLFPSELQLVVTDGAAGRERLQRLFIDQGTHHLSSLVRAPVA